MTPMSKIEREAILTTGYAELREEHPGATDAEMELLAVQLMETDEEFGMALLEEISEILKTERGH